MPTARASSKDSGQPTDSKNSQVLNGYHSFRFHHQDINHLVYHRGDLNHPPLLLMSELAGIAPGLLMFADRLIENRYQVYLPWMFGPLGRRAPIRNAIRLCISREFSRLQAGVSAPITDWLRALTQYISEQNGGRTVGAIGMCLTGAFAIPLIIDPHVTVGVAAQPSVPFSIFHTLTGLDVPGASQMNVSDADIAAARQRLNDGAASLFACRYRADRICPAQKLERLRREFSINLEVHEYGDHGSRNVTGNRPHATFTREYRIAGADVSDDHPSRVAFQDLLVFLDLRLKSG